MFGDLLKRLPNWVINIGAIVLIVLFAILAVSPPMVSGDIVCRLTDSTRCPSMSVNVNFNGRDIRTTVKDGTGTFYLPVVNKLSGLYATVYYFKDGVEWRIPHEIEFDLASIWQERSFRVKFTATGENEFGEPEIVRSGGNWMASLFELFDWSNKTAMFNVLSATPANAQEIMNIETFKDLIEQPATNALPSETLPPSETSAIDNGVAGAFRSIENGDPTPDPTKLTIDQIGTLNRNIYINTGLAIAPEHWKYIQSENDAAKYIKSMRALGITYSAGFGPGTESWTETQRKFESQNNTSIVVAPPVGN